MAQIVQVQKFVSSGHNGTVWADPVDQPILGWSPVMSEEDPTTGQFRKITRRNLFIRRMAVTITSKDQIVMDGSTWQVAGDPSDWNQGPYGYQPGYVVTIQKVAG